MMVKKKKKRKKKKNERKKERNVLKLYLAEEERKMSDVETIIFKMMRGGKGWRDETRKRLRRTKKPKKKTNSSLSPT
jgi:hypothetical protein